MSWNPTTEQYKYLELIASMTIDCMAGKGAESLETYRKNLLAISDQIPDIERDPAVDEGL